MTMFTFIAEIVTILKKGSATHSYCEVWPDKTSAITTLPAISTNPAAVTTGVSWCFKILFIFSTQK